MDLLDLEQEKFQYFSNHDTGGENSPFSLVDRLKICMISSVPVPSRIDGKRLAIIT
jgi:hypothetical protein